VDFIGHMRKRPEADSEGFRLVIPASRGDESAALYQGTTSQGAEKLGRAVGRGFIPVIKPMESLGASASEVCSANLANKSDHAKNSSRVAFSRLRKQKRNKSKRRTPILPVKDE
jgi:hypothetical protein